ncbi:hypothetical protein Hamer_G007227, partial [Homarus americanus]
GAATQTSAKGCAAQPGRGVRGGSQVGGCEGGRATRDGTGGATAARVLLRLARARYSSAACGCGGHQDLGTTLPRPRPRHAPPHLPTLTPSQNSRRRLNFSGEYSSTTNSQTRGQNSTDVKNQ